MMIGEPEYLNFKPYKVNEITEIIKERLLEASPSKDKLLMDDRAIELCARKVVGTGDLRSALDVCRKALELVETETKIQTPTRKPLSPVNHSTVTIKHVMQATAKTSSSSLLKITSLNLHPQLVLVSYLSLEAKKIKSITYGAVTLVHSLV
jgi:cell division control protein 6